MNTSIGKSTYTRLTRTSIEQSKEQKELDNLNNIINKLKQEVYNNERNINSTLNKFSSIKRSKSNIYSKTNYTKPSISRIKDDRTDKEFLSNLMDIDENLPILPQNMHLLCDNDTNQSISSKQKFRNLAKLMMDDKESVVEKNFVHNNIERFNLHLYNALSKKSKKVFIETEKDKLNKLQLFFKRINRFKMPEIIIHNNSNLNQNFNSNEIKENINENNLNEKEFTSFFESKLPNITSDLLSYINHNIINIEDIYNSNSKNYFEDNDDDFVMNIESVDINQKENIIKKFDNSKKIGINLFTEFNNICPDQEVVDILNDIPTMKMFEKNKKLQNKFYNKISLISEFKEKYFPNGNLNLSEKQIYRFAKNNKNVIEEKTDSFTIQSGILNEIEDIFLNQKKKEEEENLNFNSNQFSEESKLIITDNENKEEEKINRINESRKVSIIKDLSNLQSFINKKQIESDFESESKKSIEKNDSEDVFSKFINIDNYI